MSAIFCCALPPLFTFFSRSSGALDERAGAPHGGLHGEDGCRQRESRTSSQAACAGSPTFCAGAQTCDSPDVESEMNHVAGGAGENSPSRVFVNRRESGGGVVARCRAFALSLAAGSPRTFASPPTLREPAKSRLENLRPNPPMSARIRTREKRRRPPDRRNPPAIPRLSRVRSGTVSSHESEVAVGGGI